MFEGMTQMCRLADQLLERDVTQRLCATQSLARMDTPDAAELLLAALDDCERTVRDAALDGLAAMGYESAARKVLGVLRGAWDEIDGLRQAQDRDRGLLLRAFERFLRRTDSARAWVIHALGRLGDRRAIPWIRPYLNSRVPVRQRAACIALGLLEDRGSVPRLLRLVEHSQDGHVAHCAATALERLGEKPLMDAYRGIPNGESKAIDEAVRLIDEGDKRIVRLLLSGLKHSEHRCNTINTALVLCGLREPRAVPRVCAMLEEVALDALDHAEEDDVEKFMVSVVKVLGSFSLPEAATAAVNLLADPLYRSWQPEMARGLAETINPAALPAVLELLYVGARQPEPNHYADTEICTITCRLLGKIGDRGSIGPLLVFLTDPAADEDLSEAAAAAIDGICDRDPTAACLLPRLA